MPTSVDAACLIEIKYRLVGYSYRGVSGIIFAFVAQNVRRLHKNSITSGINLAKLPDGTLLNAKIRRVLFSYVLSWPEPVHDSFALFLENIDGWSECSEAAFAEQCHFSSGRIGVGSVVCGDDGLYVVGAQPDL